MTTVDATAGESGRPAVAEEAPAAAVIGPLAGDPSIFGLGSFIAGSVALGLGLVGVVPFGRLMTCRFSEALSNTWPPEAEPIPYLVGEFSKLGALTLQFKQDVSECAARSVGVSVGILWGRQKGGLWGFCGGIPAQCHRFFCSCGQKAAPELASMTGGQEHLGLLLLEDRSRDS